MPATKAVTVMAAPAPEAVEAEAVAEAEAITKAHAEAVAKAYADAIAAAVEAFRDTEAVFHQGAAINAEAFHGEKKEDVSKGIAEARVRDRFAPTQWKANADGTGPTSYAEAVSVLARQEAFTRSVSPASIEKHRAAWSLITEAAVSHANAEAYGDAFLITRSSGGIGAARKGTAAIAALPEPERAAAFRDLADGIIPTRAKAKEDAKAKAATKRAEDAKAKAEAEARGAALSPAERVGVIVRAAIAAEDTEGALSREDREAIAAVLRTIANAEATKAEDTLSATGAKATPATVAKAKA